MALEMTCLSFGLALFYVLVGPLLAQDSNPVAPAKIPSKVVIVRDPQATEAFEPRPEIVNTMMDRAVVALLGETNAAAAWARLVKTQDIVGIKVYSLPGAMAGTRPAVVAAVVQGLLAAKVPPQHIVIWDRRLADLRNAGFGELAKSFGVRLAGSLNTGYDEDAFYDSPLLGTLLSGDLEFGKGQDVLARKSHVSKLVSRELTRIINVSPVLNSYSAGVVGHLYSLSLGSVDNVRRFEDNPDPDTLARAVPEIYALSAVGDLGDRVALNITDALICQFEGGEKVRLHNAVVLNEIRVSRDPVALDVLSTRDLATARARAGFPVGNTNYFEIYQNAAALDLGGDDPARIQIETLP